MDNYLKSFSLSKTHTILTVSSITLLSGLWYYKDTIQKFANRFTTNKNIPPVPPPPVPPPPLPRELEEPKRHLKVDKGTMTDDTNQNTTLEEVTVGEEASFTAKLFPSFTTRE